MNYSFTIIRYWFITELEASVVLPFQHRLVKLSKFPIVLRRTLHGLTANIRKV